MAFTAIICAYLAFFHAARLAGLDPSRQFVPLAFVELNRVFRPTGNFLSGFAFGDVPIPFDQQRVHGVCPFIGVIWSLLDSLVCNWRAGSIRCAAALIFGQLIQKSPHLEKLETCILHVSPNGHCNLQCELLLPASRIATFGLKSHFPRCGTSLACEISAIVINGR